VGVEYRHANNVKYSTLLGTGPEWIFNSKANSTVGDEWPVGYSLTFQTLFNVPHCPFQGILNITVDNSFIAYLNGAIIGVGNNWFDIYNFTVNFKQGVNNLTVVTDN